MPGAIPETTPDVASTETYEEAELHVPPPAASERVIDEDVHTAEGPVMAPANGIGFTVTL